MTESRKNVVFDHGIELRDGMLICFNSTFPMDEIRYLEIISNRTSFRGPLFLGLIGLIFFLIHWLAAALVLFIALIWAYKNKKIYGLVVHTHDGQKFQPLLHYDRAFLETVIKKCREEMDKRGSNDEEN